MLVERFNERLNNRKNIEFNNVHKDLLDWLEDIVTENNCYVEKREWKSKYNSYVVYNYEPFCSEGFDINITVSSNSLEHLYFLKYLYANKLNTIEFLNNCMLN